MERREKIRALFRSLHAQNFKQSLYLYRSYVKRNVDDVCAHNLIAPLTTVKHVIQMVDFDSPPPARGGLDVGHVHQPNHDVTPHSTQKPVTRWGVVCDQIITSRTDPLVA